MALLFLDSFDHYVTADFAEKWTTVTGAGGATNIHATDGRRSSPCLRSNQDVGGFPAGSAVSKTFAPADTTMITGFACKPDSVATDYPLFLIGDNTNWHCGIYGAGAGLLNVRRGDNYTGTVLGSTSAALPNGVYTYVEIKFTIHDSAGVVVIKFNEFTVLNLSGVDTRNATAAGWTRLGYGTAGTMIRLDDLYVLDGSGPAPHNDFLGDCRVDARYPTAEGASSAWTPLSGTDNALMVDETAPDDDTTYNSTSTVGATDTLVVQDAPVPGAALYGVQLCLSVKKSDAGTCAVAPVVRHSGTDYPGTAVNPTTSYAYVVAPYGTNPGTGAAWTEAGFNAAEFGYKRTA
jgi:hypothetical protein